MNERELSRLAVLSEALVRRPEDFAELVSIMRESNRLEVNSQLADAVRLIEQAFQERGLENLADEEAALTQLIEEMNQTDSSLQKDVARMLAWAMEVDKLNVHY